MRRRIVMGTTPSTKRPEPTRFEDAFDYLTSWFHLLGPAYMPDESRAGLADIPPFEDRIASMKTLERITECTSEARISLPLEEYIRQNELDLIDRLLLLSLLRAALDPLTDGGLPLIKLLWALGASSVGAQWEVRRRLDHAGQLRDAGIIECVPSPDLFRCRYRLSSRFIQYLTTGDADNRGLPRIPENRLEALDALQYDITQLIEAVKLAPHDTGPLWHGVRPGHPGWDRTVLRRGRLAARLQAACRQNDSVGTELRRLELNTDDRLAWALLFYDSSAEQVGLAVPFVLTFVGCDEDAEPAAARLLGPKSKMAKAGVLRFNRTDAPLLTRIVGVSQEARSRVALWPKNAFAMKPGFSLDLTSEEQRTLGFAPSNGIQDRTATSSGEASR
jgi:hypothetical protein